MKSLAASFASVLRAFRYGPRLRPTRDWLVLLSLFTLLLIGSVLWNVVQFFHVVQGQKIGNETVHAPEQIELEAVQALFVQRAAERAKYQSEYRFVDPSR